MYFVTYETNEKSMLCGIFTDIDVLKKQLALIFISMKYIKCKITKIQEPNIGSPVLISCDSVHGQTATIWTYIVKSEDEQETREQRIYSRTAYIEQELKYLQSTPISTNKFTISIVYEKVDSIEYNYYMIYLYNVPENRKFEPYIHILTLNELIYKTDDPNIDQCCIKSQDLLYYVQVHLWRPYKKLYVGLYSDPNDFISKLINFSKMVKTEDSIVFLDYKITAIFWPKNRTNFELFENEFWKFTYGEIMFKKTTDSLENIRWYYDSDTKIFNVDNHIIENFDGLYNLVKMMSFTDTTITNLYLNYEKHPMSSYSFTDTNLRTIITNKFIPTGIDAIYSCQRKLFVNGDLENIQL